MIRLLFTLSAVCCSCLTFGQKKFERESRIKEKELPKNMVEKLKPYLNNVKRLKYYEEFDGSSTSYEAKFIYYDNKFSVEFSNEGDLQDVEVIRCFEELPHTVQNNIVEYLYPNNNFKIKKTQKQFSGSGPDQQIIEDALANIDNDTIRYELIVEVQPEKNWSEFEMLFDADGKFISKKLVIQREEDHVLY